MAGQIYEVVGGGDTGGVIVRISRHRNSPQFPERLSSGSLVMGRELVGDRLLYDRIAGTGYGPDSGWVCLRQGARDLLVDVDVKPPKAGWKILTAELPTYVPLPPEAKQPAISGVPGAYDALPPYMGKGEDPGHIQPQTEQVVGDPYVFYHQINFNDTKGGGLRLSACLAAMDECRTDLFALCDQTVEACRKVINPFTMLAIELKPEILRLDSDDGLLYAHPQSSGPVLSWLRMEAQFGWPMFPMRNEEQTIYLVGKDKRQPKAGALATGRFQLVFCDDSGEKSVALFGEEWESTLDKFFSKVKAHHSSTNLNERQLSKLYPSGGRPFTPNKQRKVTWRMSYIYCDLWKILYHCRVPELIWEVNMQAGSDFADLVKDEPDPQAIAIALPKKMSVGTTYDIYCFLEEASKKACYVFMPEDSTSPSDCVLAVCALYDWRVPQDGRTLHAEDLEVVGASGRVHLINFATGGGEAKTTKYLDLEKLTL